MFFAFNALFPIFSLILLGGVLKRIHFFEDNIWAGLEKLSYYILMPVLLIFVLSTKKLDGVPWQDIALAVSIPILIAALILWVSRIFFPTIAPARFTSFFQGGVRFNTYVGLAIAQGLYGAKGVLIGAIGAGFMIVLINLLCVMTFSYSLHNDKNVIKTTLVQVSRNPLILACLIGWILNVSGLHLPHSISRTLEVLGQASLPIALISIGATLKLKSCFHNKRQFLLISLVQFLIKPLCAAASCFFLGLSGMTAATLILFLSTPTAPSSYILSRQLGGDHQLMASIIAQQTLFAFLSLPLTIWLIDQFLFAP